MSLMSKNDSHQQKKAEANAGKHSPQTELVQAMTSLLVDGDYSDMTVYCGNLSWKAHRSIICPRSKVLKAHCSNDFKEGQTRQLRLDADDPATVARMMDYFYKLDYRNGFETAGSDNDVLFSTFATNQGPFGGASVGEAATTQCDEEPSLGPSPSIVNAHVYAIADKYEIWGLKALSRSKFKASIRDSWQDKTYPEVIRLVYCSTPDQDLDLRQAVADLAESHLPQLLGKDDFRAVLNDVSDFAFHVLQWAARRRF